MTTEWWKDKEFVAVLDKRTADYKNGKVKGVRWEKAKKQILGLRKKSDK